MDQFIYSYIKKKKEKKEKEILIFFLLGSTGLALAQGLKKVTNNFVCFFSLCPFCRDVHKKTDMRPV